MSGIQFVIGGETQPVPDGHFRVTTNLGDGSKIVTDLDRAQAEKLRDDLTAWLDHGPAIPITDEMRELFPGRIRQATMNVERMRRYVQRTGYYADRSSNAAEATSEFALGGWQLGDGVPRQLVAGFRTSLWPEIEGIAEAERVAVFRDGRVVGLGGMTGNDLIRMAERELRAADDTP